MDRRPASTPIERAVVQEAYDAAALAVSRLNSPGWNDDYYYIEDDSLAYYEGKRDALRALLEPPTDD